MKKISLLFAIVIGFITIVTAQSTFGVKGGVNFSNLAIDKDQVDESNTKTGFTFGLTNMNQSDLFFVQSELLYNRKGAEYKIGGITVDANLDYVQVPVSIGINLFNTPLNIYGGGYVAYLVNANYEYKNGDDVVATYDNKDAFNKLDLGVHAGVSLNLQAVLLDFRLSRGVRNVEDDEIVTNLQTFTQNDTMNFNLELTAAFQF